MSAFTFVELFYSSLLYRSDSVRFPSVLSCAQSVESEQSRSLSRTVGIFEGNWYREPSKGFLICTVCVCVLSPYLRTWLVQLAAASRTERRVYYIILSRGGKLTPVEASDNSNLAPTICLAECRRVYFLVRVQARVHANSAPEFKGALAACGAASLGS